MLLEILLFSEDQVREEAKTAVFKGAMLSAFPSSKMFETLYKDGASADPVEEVYEVSMDSDEIHDILSSLGIGTDTNIPLVED